MCYKNNGVSLLDTESQDEASNMLNSYYLVMIHFPFNSKHLLTKSDPISRSSRPWVRVGSVVVVGMVEG